MRVKTFEQWLVDNPDIAENCPNCKGVQSVTCPNCDGDGACPCCGTKGKCEDCGVTELLNVIAKMLPMRFTVSK